MGVSDHLSDEITALARQDAECGRLVSVPGIGPIISSAMVAAIGNGDAFAKGRLRRLAGSCAEADIDW
jgi:transposase